MKWILLTSSILFAFQASAASLSCVITATYDVSAVDSNRAPQVIEVKANLYTKKLDQNGRIAAEVQTAQAGQNALYVCEGSETARTIDINCKPKPTGDYQYLEDSRMLVKIKKTSAKKWKGTAHVKDGEEDAVHPIVCASR